MFSKYKFTCETYSDTLWREKPDLTGTITVEDVSDPCLDELCESFCRFLHACGFSGFESVEVVFDEPGICSGVSEDEDVEGVSGGAFPDESSSIADERDKEHQDMLEKAVAECKEGPWPRHSPTSTWSDGVVSTRKEQS